jgi:hypothetical protein
MEGRGKKKIMETIDTRRRVDWAGLFSTNTKNFSAVLSEYDRSL